jgi:hypothetical protein
MQTPGGIAPNPPSSVGMHTYPTGQPSPFQVLQPKIGGIRSSSAAVGVGASVGIETGVKSLVIKTIPDGAERMTGSSGEGEGLGMTSWRFTGVGGPGMKRGPLPVAEEAVVGRRSGVGRMRRLEGEAAEEMGVDATSWPEGEGRTTGRRDSERSRLGGMSCRFEGEAVDAASDGRTTGWCGRRGFRLGGTSCRLLMGKAGVRAARARRERVVCVKCMVGFWGGVWC